MLQMVKMGSSVFLYKAANYQHNPQEALQLESGCRRCNNIALPILPR
jgi:hypothetical protein